MQFPILLILGLNFAPSQNEHEQIIFIGLLFLLPLQAGRSFLGASKGLELNLTFCYSMHVINGTGRDNLRLISCQNADLKNGAFTVKGFFNFSSYIKICLSSWFRFCTDFCYTE